MHSCKQKSHALSWQKNKNSLMHAYCKNSENENMAYINAFLSTTWSTLGDGLDNLSSRDGS